MASFSWTIVDMQRRQTTGAVIEVAWQCIGTEIYDEITYTESLSDITKYVPDIDSPDFVAYEDLTESIVLSWLDTSEIEIRLQVRLDNAISGRRASGIPW